MAGMSISRGSLLLVTFLALGIAADLPAEAQITGPCAETIAKYCKDVTPGGGRVMKCISDNRDDQSMACREWLDDQNRSLKELNTSCAEETARLCSIDPPDSIRLYRCLEDNYIALKSGCREKLREIKDRMQ